jgi:hypothetical protein
MLRKLIEVALPLEAINKEAKYPTAAFVAVGAPEKPLARTWAPHVAKPKCGHLALLALLDGGGFLQNGPDPLPGDGLLS